MADKINIPIVTTYDDKDAKKALKDAEKLDKTEVEIPVTAKVDQVLNAFDDVVNETKRLQAAADALGNALGPELAAKADTTSIVQDLQRAGLTIEEIIADADKLGGKLKEVADTDVGGKLGSNLGTTRGKLDEVRASADSSKSVLANMVGNSVQDVGALAGVSGSAGVAIGQMGEYMADARAKGQGLTTILQDFSKVAGPIAAVSVGLAVVNGILSEMRSQQAASDERTKAFGKSLDETSDNVVGFSQVLRENEDDLRDWTGTVDGVNSATDDWAANVATKLPGIGKFFEDTSTDLIDVAGRAGLSIYDLSARIDHGTETTAEFSETLLDAYRSGKITRQEFYALADAMKEQGSEAQTAKDRNAAVAEVMKVTAEEANALLQELLKQEAPLEHYTDQWNTLFDDLSDGTIDTEESADAINFLAEALGISQAKVISLASAEQERRDGIKRTVPVLHEFTGAQDAVNASIETALEDVPTLTEVLDAAAQAHRDTASSINEEVTARRAAADSTFALHAAEANFLETAKQTNETLADSDTTLIQAREAMDDVAQSAGDVADANVRVAEDTARAEGKTVSATRKLDIWNRSMLEQASTLDGPARDALLGYIGNVNDIPPERMTAINAAIARGDLQEAQRLLDEASAARTATITADAETDKAEAEINETARDRAVRLNLFPNNNGLIRYSAAGGSGGGRTWVGEDGPELLDLPAGSRVYPTSVSRAMALNDGGGAPMVVNINMPRGSRGVDVVKQVTGQARRSGRRYGTPVVHYARR